MGRSNRFPGLKLRGGVWWLDIDNERYGRIYESTNCPEEHRTLAEARYTLRTGAALQAKVLGIRPRRLFSAAAEKHLEEVLAKRTAKKPRHGEQDEWALDHLLPAIGSKYLDEICDETLAPLKASLKLKGKHGRPCKDKTVNLVLQVARKILNKAARRWRENGKTWLETAPLLDIPAPGDSRPPYPLSWDEERKLLLPELPSHLADPCLFIANAGPRSVTECCSLRWEWERRLPELDTPDFKVVLFVLPTTKNGQERVLVLNRIAQAAIERQRGKHDEFVWTYEGNPLKDLNNTAWEAGRARAVKRYEEVLGRECPEGFRTLHVHDLRHTFGRRLRAAGVQGETRDELLGHAKKGSDMTTHYSAAELSELVAAVRKIEVPLGSVPTLSVIRAAAA